MPSVVLRYFTDLRPPAAARHGVQPASSERRSAGEPIEVYGDGGQQRDFTYVGDAVEATVAAGSRGEPGRAYNVAGGNVATLSR